MSYILLFIYLVLLVWLINTADFYKYNGLPKYIPAIVFLSKFLGGLLVYIIYAYFYGSRYSGDIFKYFDDGNVIYSSLKQNPVDYLKMITGIGGDAPYLQKYYDTCRFWNKQFNYGLINDNRIVIRFNALVRLISMGNMHIHTLVMSFISFTGLWGIFKVFISFFKQQKILLLLVIFFFPSVYFWTSGVLKEGILMFAFGMFLYNYIRLINGDKIVTSIVWLCTTTFILLLSKFYVLVAALPGLLFFALISKSGKKYFFVKLVASVLFFITVSFFTKPIIGVSFPEIIEKKQHDFVAYINSLSVVGSKIDIPDLEPTFKSIVTNSPSAFFRTLFRPTVFEISNLMSVMAAVENLIIMLFILLTIGYFNFKALKNEYMWLALLFVLVLFTLSGLTTPVLGALVRYKAPALPFLGIALLYLLNFEKIELHTKKIMNKYNALK